MSCESIETSVVSRHSKTFCTLQLSARTMAYRCESILRTTASILLPLHDRSTSNGASRVVTRRSEVDVLSGMVDSIAAACAAQDAGVIAFEDHSAVIGPLQSVYMPHFFSSTAGRAAIAVIDPLST